MEEARCDTQERICLLQWERKKGGMLTPNRVKMAEENGFQNGVRLAAGLWGKAEGEAGL